MSGTATGRREQAKTANRAAILAAARDAFGELGYGTATVRDVARRTQLASGTIYNYFPGKEAMFRALVDDVAAEARRRVRRARRAASTPREFVAASYRAFFELIVEDPATFSFMRRNAGTLRALFGEATLPAATGELAEDLRDAIERGGVPAVDVEYCAHAMVAVGVELGERLMEREPPDVEGATDFATLLFVGAFERLSAAR